MRAVLKNYKQSPRKVRLVADLIRGKSVSEARAALTYVSKKSSPQLLKLLNSAVANARGHGANPDTLKISKITVDKGLVFQRANPMMKSRGATIRRQRSIIRLELATVEKAEGRRQRTEKKNKK